MAIDRRTFHGLSLGLAASWAVAGTGVARGAARMGRLDSGLFDWTNVKGRASVGMKAGGNALVVRTSKDSVILIDCKDPGLGGALRRDCEARGRLQLVVNTHHHLDHSGGNCAFTPDVGVVAHVNARDRCLGQFDSCLERMRGALARMGGRPDRGSNDAPASELAVLKDIEGWLDSLKPEDVAPTDTMKTSVRAIVIDDVTLQLRHVGPGHTDNDIFAWFPDMNVLHTGDLLFNGLHPYIDVGAGATTRGWDKSIGAMVALCNEKTVIIPGHGDVTDVRGLRAQTAYFENLRRIVGKAKDAGLAREEVMKLSDPSIDSLGFEQLKARNLGVVFDEMTA